MVSIFDFSFWLTFIYFWLVVVLAFTIPGQVILGKLKLTTFQRIILATIIGMVLWGWQGYIFGFLGIRWLSYVYLIIFVLVWLKINLKIILSKEYLKFKISLRDIDFVLLIIIISGVFIQLSKIWFNGIWVKDGLYFCCTHIFDIFLHLALTNELTKHFPPYEPGMYDTYVQNYHYWGNLVVSELIRVFNLPLIQTQYQYSTLFVSLFLGLTAFTFGKLLNIGKNFNRWLVFFLYFGGDLIFFLILLLGKGLDFKTMSSLEDGVKFLSNPPRAFAIIVFFAGLSLFYLWIKKRNLKLGILMAILFATTVGFKVYVGIFALTGLAALSLYFLLKKDFKMLIPAILAGLLSAVVYLPVNSNAGGLYFTGLWMFENFIVQPKLGLERMELARTIFYEHQNWIRVAIQEAIYIVLFIFSIFGSKLLGIFQTRKSLSKFPLELNIFLISGILVSAVGGLFFQQKSGQANTFNFLVSIFIIGSLYSALSSTYWISKVKSRFSFFIILIIIIFTMPRVFYETFANINSISRREGYIIEKKELEIFEFLKNKTDKDSLILVDHRSFGSDAQAPYISFMTNRPSFLSGMEDELSAHNIDYSFRQKNVDYIFKQSDPLLVGKLLLINKIDYIIMSNTYNLESTYSANFLKPVFINEKFKVLKFSENLAKEYFINNK